MKFSFRPIYGTFGWRVGDRLGRWLVLDMPWTEDVREFGTPLGIAYYGKRWCWGYRPRSKFQRYDWKHQHFSGEWGHFRFYPRDSGAREATCGPLGDGQCWRTKQLQLRANFLLDRARTPFPLPFTDSVGRWISPPNSYHLTTSPPTPTTQTRGISARLRRRSR